MGAAVGARTRRRRGPGEGAAVGAAVGSGVGAAVGAGEGAGVGPGEGATVGEGVGAGVGPGVGACVGTGVGPGVGAPVGAGLGAGVGVRELLLGALSVSPVGQRPFLFRLMHLHQARGPLTQNAILSGHSNPQVTRCALLNSQCGGRCWDQTWRGSGPW